MTQEHDDISSVVSRRCAAFCLTFGIDRSLAEWKSDATKLYNLRSRLVHGDMSPLTPEVQEGAYLGANLARQTILSVMHHFGTDGLNAERVSTKRLAKWFDAVVAASEQFDRERQQIRPEH